MTYLFKPDAGAPPTIMVIDPDVLVRLSLAEYLRGCGYEVLEGRDAGELWAVLASDRTVDIVLADVGLGGSANGFELAKRVRAEHPAIDVILASGTAKVADKAGELCDESPVGRPYHPDEIVKRINLLRERRRTSDKPPDQ